MHEQVVPDYLDLLDSQRQAVSAALDGLSEEQSGDIFSHTIRSFGSLLPLRYSVWNRFEWWGQRRRDRPYGTEIENVYERPNSCSRWAGTASRSRKLRPSFVPVS